MCVCCSVCPTLCEYMDYNPLGSSAHGILQARILEWVAFPFSSGCSQPRDQTRVACIASLVAQLVKNPPAMRETWVGSLGWEDPLEKGTTTHSSVLAWRIPWTV